MGASTALFAGSDDSEDSGGPPQHGSISGLPSAACPRPFSVEKWTTIDPGRESVGRALCFTLDFGVIVHDEVSRFFFEGHIEDGYAERGAVEPRYSRVMHPSLGFLLSSPPILG